MAAPIYLRSFAGGELSPQFYGMVQDTKFQTGLALCRNAIILPHGPVQNRTGTALVRETKDSTKRARLIPFRYNSETSYVLEFGHNYIRFHTLGATVLSGGSPYEVVTTYTQDEVFDITYIQNAETLTLCHPNHPPAELVYSAPTSWALNNIVFGSLLSAPTGVSATATAGTGTPVNIDHTYKVTAVNGAGLDESLPSSSATCSNDLLLDGAYNTIDWSSVSGAARYNVYKLYRGLYGYIGQTDAITFVDDNIAPNLSITPPIDNTPFGSSNNYPRATSYYQQRRVFAGTNNKPVTTWMTRSATDNSLTYSLPSQADDAIEFTIKGRQASRIQHIVPFISLLVLTTEGEWGIDVSDGVATANPQSYIGANNVQPTVINTNVIYATNRGGHLRELGYSFQDNGFVTSDLCLRATHLFDGDEIVDMSFSKAPYQINWAVSSNGSLLGLTYVPEEKVGGWHQHTTLNGSFESVCAVPESGEDVVYVIVNRTLNGSSYRMVEYLKPRNTSVQNQAFFVDCGGTYSGAATDTITGLDWLNGEEVSIFADGAVHPSQTVVSGTITLDYEASVVHVGLPIVCDIQTLPILEMEEADVKNINEAWMRVFESSGIFVGPDEDSLVEHKQRTTESLDTPPAFYTGKIELDLFPFWNNEGQMLIRQTDPLPLTVCSIKIKVSDGG